MDEMLAAAAGPDAVAASGGAVPRRDLAYWRLAIAGIRSVMTARLSGGGLCQADWAAEVLGHALVIDLNERSEHLLGGPEGRDEMIGRSRKSGRPTARPIWPR
jgi:hypothetical protein